MIRYRGLAMPDGETHLIGWMEKKGQMLDGRPAYQLHKYRAALAYAKGRRRAVDVGANIGLWSLAMAADFQLVRAYEPVPAYADCWRANLEGKENAHLRPVALGAAPGLIGLHRPDASSNGDTWIAGEGEEPNAAAGVEMTTLDAENLSDIDLIKLDCEGYEQLVLEGGRETLLRCKPVVIVEQKPGRPQARGLGRIGAVEYLQQMGAKFCKEISGDFILAWV